MQKKAAKQEDWEGAPMENAEQLLHSPSSVPWLKAALLQLHSHMLKHSTLTSKKLLRLQVSLFLSQLNPNSSLCCPVWSHDEPQCCVGFVLLNWV